jgi:DNA-binding MarR family transcriptional regulator
MSNFLPGVPTPETSGDAVDDVLREVEQQLSLLWRRAHSLSHQLSRQVHPDMEPASYGLLTVIRQEGTIRLTDLASAVGVTKPSVSRQIAFLESLGFVFKAADPLDGRAQSIGLTEMGEDKMRQIQNARRQVLLERLADWPLEDVHKLTSYICRLNAAYGDKPLTDIVIDFPYSAVPR